MHILASSSSLSIKEICRRSVIVSSCACMAWQGPACKVHREKVWSHKPRDCPVAFSPCFRRGRAGRRRTRRSAVSVTCGHSDHLPDVTKACRTILHHPNGPISEPTIAATWQPRRTDIHMQMTRKRLLPVRVRLTTAWPALCLIDSPAILAALVIHLSAARARCNFSFNQPRPLHQFVYQVRNLSRCWTKKKAEPKR